MQSNRVEEVRGINDNYNPLPLSIEHRDDNRCTILMRNETHTIGSLVKERLLRARLPVIRECSLPESLRRIYAFEFSSIHCQEDPAASVSVHLLDF